MSRSVYSLLFVFCLGIFSVAAVGCGESNEVIVDDRSQAEIEQEEADYEAQMEAAEGDDVTE